MVKKTGMGMGGNRHTWKGGSEGGQKVPKPQTEIGREFAYMGEGGKLTTAPHKAKWANGILSESRVGQEQQKKEKKKQKEGGRKAEEEEGEREWKCIIH
jgi:hypothetical protein